MKRAMWWGTKALHCLCEWIWKQIILHFSLRVTTIKLTIWL
jgi:hypothetical protein